MSNPITRNHRLSVARAWEGGMGLHEPRDFVSIWIETGELTSGYLATCKTLERLAQLVADAEGAWIPFDDEYTWEFNDTRIDDDGVSHYMPLTAPKPPEQP